MENEPNKVNGVLSYLGILWLVPFLTTRDKEKDEYTLCHLKQGFGLLLLNIAIQIVARIVPLLGFLGLVGLILMIIGIINACKGEAKELPLIGGLAKSVTSFIK